MQSVSSCRPRDLIDESRSFIVRCRLGWPAHFVELANFYQVSVQALIKRLEALKRLPYGTWERLKEEGFKVRRAQEMLNLNPQATVVEGMPRHYVTMAVYAFRKGLITEGELARLLRVDRLTAREEVQRHTDPLHSEEEGFVGTNQTSESVL